MCERCNGSYFKSTAFLSVKEMSSLILILKWENPWRPVFCFPEQTVGKQSDIVFLNHRNSIFFASSVMEHAFLFILWLGILFVIHMHEITATFSENGLLFFFWSCIERYINTHHILNKAIIIRGVSYLNFTDRINRKKANTIF